MWGVARVTCLVAIITVIVQSELPHAVHELHLSHPGLAIFGHVVRAGGMEYDVMLGRMKYRGWRERQTYRSSRTSNRIGHWSQEWQRLH